MTTNDLLFMGVVTLVLLLPVPFLGYWGWRYGRSKDSTPLGFVTRIIVVASVGSWALATSVGHGVGIAPIPSLICAYSEIGHDYTSCYPWAWVTPTISVVVFFLSAVAGSRKLAASARGGHWR